MPQRKEDYMSTLNVGGNRKGGTDAMPNDPFSYLKTKPEHAYLGHFKNPTYLRAGHNVSRYSRGVSAAVPPSRRSVDPVRRPTVDPGPLVGVAARVPKMVAEALSPRAARRAIRGGDATVAAARPVAAARVAARQQGIRGPERRAMIRAARRSPESARSERRAGRRTVRVGTRVY